MLIPRASVSVANTTLMRPALEQALDDLLEHRQQAGVVRGQSALEGLEPLVEAQGGEVLVGELQGGLERRLRGWRVRSSPVVSRRPECRHWRTASSQPARLNRK